MFALHRQTRSLAKRFVFGIVVVFLLALTSHTAKAFLPIGIAVGAGMVGGAMQDESSRKQQSQQSEQYQRSQSATERKPKKKTTKAKTQKPNDAFAKESPPKAKSPEPVANAPQAKPLTAGAPPTPDKFGE
jgi:membrane protease subunit (stomatin/prohibitin family)